MRQTPLKKSHVHFSTKIPLLMARSETCIEMALLLFSCTMPTLQLHTSTTTRKHLLIPTLSALTLMIMRNIFCLRVEDGGEIVQMELFSNMGLKSLGSLLLS